MVTSGLGMAAIALRRAGEPRVSAAGWPKHTSSDVASVADHVCETDEWRVESGELSRAIPLELLTPHSPLPTRPRRLIELAKLDARVVEEHAVEADAIAHTQVVERVDVRLPNVVRQRDDDRGAVAVETKDSVRPVDLANGSLKRLHVARPRGRSAARHRLIDLNQIGVVRAATRALHPRRHLVPSLERGHGIVLILVDHRRLIVEQQHHALPVRRLNRDLLSSGIDPFYIAAQLVAALRRACTDTPKDAAELAAGGGRHEQTSRRCSENHPMLHHTSSSRNPPPEEQSRCPNRPGV